MADGAQSRKLRFEVAFVSGQDPEYPASELNVHSPETRGWASPQFSDFPVELGLKFLRAPVRIQQLQILSHQSKIATRIELFVGRGSDYFSAEWRRLGYLSLDSNERSHYRARELKSVYVDARGHFLKLMVHKPHQNSRNLLSQVGIVAVNALGTALPTDSVPLTFKSSTDAASSSSSSGGGGGGGAGGDADDPRRRRSGGRSGSGRAGRPPPAPGADDLAVDMGLDRETAALYRDLHAKKLAAVSREDFAAAKGFKEAEDMVRALGGQLAGLIRDKRAAVEAEDYDRAAAVKSRIDSIRGEEVTELAQGLAASTKPAAEMAG